MSSAAAPMPCRVNQSWATGRNWRDRTSHPAIRSATSWPRNGISSAAPMAGFLRASLMIGASASSSYFPTITRGFSR